MSKDGAWCLSQTGSRATETNVSVPRRPGGWCLRCYLPSSRSRLWHTRGELPRPCRLAGPGLSERGTGQGGCTQGCTLVFQFPMPALRWQRGMTQGHTPSGMTQIQRQSSSSRPSPPRPVVARPQGQEVAVAIHLWSVTCPSPGQLATPAQRHKSLDFAPHLTGSSRQPRVNAGR